MDRTSLKRFRQILSDRADEQQKRLKAARCSSQIGYARVYRLGPEQQLGSEQACKS
jgi:hypothetical protein